MTPSSRVLNPKDLCERPVEIMVGSTKKIYYVHSSILASCDSTVLNARMTGAWKDNAKDKPLDWTNFDEVTAECALSYLYVKDYYVPVKPCEPWESSSGNQSKEKESQPETRSGQSAIQEQKGQREAELKRPLTPLDKCLRAGLAVETRPTAAGSFRQTPEKNRDYGWEILTHAQVYCFAHYFLFHELEQLALQRMAQVLLLLDANSMRHFVPDLADATRAVYGGTSEPQMGQDSARKLLSQFVALEYDALSGAPLDALLAQGGDFSLM